MDSRMFLVFFLLIATCTQTDEKLIIVPRDTVSKVNQSVYFNCSTTLKPEEMFWLHGEKYVYAGNRILEPYDVRFETERNNGSCNLVIHSVEPGDAGEYICSEEGFVDKHSAQLIVLDYDPICQSNIKSDGVIGQNMCDIEPDEVELSCSVSYHGNAPPAMEWKKVGDDNTITEGFSTVISNGRYNHNLKLKGDISLDNASYTCQITGTTLSPYKCNSEVIKVLYSYGMVTETSISTRRSLTCNGNNTFPCNYLWYRGEDNLFPFACNETLTNPSVGEYQCKAKCTIRGTECSFVVMKATVAEKLSPESTPLHVITGTTFVLVTIVCILIVVVIVGLLRYRQRQRSMDNFIVTEVKNDLRLRQIEEADLDDLLGKWRQHLGSVNKTQKSKRNENPCTETNVQ